MKLFYALGSFYPAQTGGADNSAYWMVRALKKEGHEIAVATTDSGIKKGQVILNRWLKTEFGELIYAKTLIHYLPFRLFCYSFKRVLWADVVHLNALFFPISIVLAYLCVLLGKPIVWSAHGELAPEALCYSPGRKGIFLKFIRLISSKVTFHATSAKEATYAKQMFGENTRVSVVPLYMELPVKQPTQPQDRYLLFIGRLHPVKALENLFLALNDCPEFKTGDWHLKIIGHGEPDYEQSLRNQINTLNLTDKVKFLGFRDGEEKYKLLANAYLTVLPSHTENFSVIVVESLSQGTPVMASLYTPWEILSSYQAGWWVDNKPAVLAENLEQVLKLQDEDYNKLRQRAFQLAKEHFDIAIHVGEWTRLYQAVYNKDSVSLHLKKEVSTFN